MLTLQSHHIPLYKKTSITPPQKPSAPQNHLQSQAHDASSLKVAANLSTETTIRHQGSSPQPPLLPPARLQTDPPFPFFSLFLSTVSKRDEEKGDPCKQRKASRKAYSEMINEKIKPSQTYWAIRANPAISHPEITYPEPRGFISTSTSTSTSSSSRSTDILPSHGLTAVGVHYTHPSDARDAHMNL